MALRDEFEASGGWLFRWRSYLPFTMFLLVGIALVGYRGLPGGPVAEAVWQGFCLAVALAGEGVRVLTVGFVPTRTSGRNTRCQKADSLNTTGIYSTVRHPLYLGNYLIGLAFALLLGVWWLPVLYTLTFWLYYERIMFAEEAFLRRTFGDEFDAWAARTPAFLPRFRGWMRPSLPFAGRAVLRRECSTVLSIAMLFPVILVAGEWAAGRTPAVGPFWIGFFAATACVYLVLRALKTRTRFLAVAGR